MRHPKVRNDLEQIANYVSIHSSIITSERKIRTIESRLKRLQRNPHIGSIRDDVYPGLRAIPVAEKGVICFVVNDAIRTIFIICIAYAGSNWLDALTERAPNLNPDADDIPR